MHNHVCTPILCPHHYADDTCHVDYRGICHVDRGICHVDRGICHVDRGICHVEMGICVYLGNHCGNPANKHAMEYVK